MQKKLENWMNLQRFAEGLERNQALILLISLPIASLGSGIAFIVEVLTMDQDEILGTGLMAVFSAFLLSLVWRGKAKEASWLFPFGICLLLSTHINHSQGIFDDAMYAFPAVIFLAGLLNQRRGILVFTLLVLIAVSVVGLNQIYRPDPLEFIATASWTRLGSILLLMTATGGIAFLATSNLLLGIRKLQESEGALAKANQELRDIQASMEETINERTRNIEAARREAEMGRHAIEAQAWIATGLSRLNDVMRGEQSIRTLADNILNQLCRYLNTQMAALFILDQGKLKRVGGFAYNLKAGLPDVFEIGEGLVGQAALAKEIILVEDIAESSVRITSGLGNAYPKNLVLLPLLFADELVGVIELGSLGILTSEQRNFLTLAEASIAISIRTTMAHIRMNELLLETQQQAEELQNQAEEMQAQEEELRAANEELFAQTERMRASRDSSVVS